MRTKIYALAAMVCAGYCAQAHAGVDLIAQSVEYVYSQRQFKVTIKNIGNVAAAESGFIQIRVNGAWQAQTLYNIQPGQSGSVFFDEVNYGVVQGNTYQAVATVDAFGSVYEDNELNNSLTTDVYVGQSPLPDLVVNNITYDSVLRKVKVAYSNVGTNSASGTQQIKVVANGYTQWIAASVPAPGGSAEASIASSYFYFVTNSTYSITAQADATYMINEAVESNNELVKSVQITGGPSLPDLTITNLTLSGGYVRVQFRNTGASIGNQQFMVRLTATSGLGYYGYVTAPTPNVTYTYTVPMSYLGFYTPGNAYTVTATVDHSNVVVESNETNNSTSRFLYGQY